MVSGVGAVQIKRGKFTEEIVWGAPNLYMGLSCHSNVSENSQWSVEATQVVLCRHCSLSIRRKLNHSNRGLKVEIVQHRAPLEVGK